MQHDHIDDPQDASLEGSPSDPPTDQQASKDSLPSRTKETEETEGAKVGDADSEATSREHGLRQVAVQYLLRQSRHQGPLPPPSTLRGYEEVVPGAAERIVDWAEREQSHRHQLEKRVVEAHVASMRRDPLLGFALVFSALLMGGYLMANGHDLKGFAIFAGAIGTAAAMAVWNRRIRKDLEETEKKALEEG